MEKFLKFLLFLFVSSLIFGQLTKVEFGSPPVVFYLHDFILAGLIFSSIIYFFAYKGRFVLPKGSVLILIFILIGAISQLNSARFFDLSQVAVGSLFLIRFAAFFLIFPIFVNLVKWQQLKFWSNLIIFVGVILAILGFFQLIFFNNLSFLQVAGFDPHIGRLVSTFLDPNFFGGFQVLILNLTLAQLFETKDKKLIFASFFLFFSIVLTFSRSSYLALFVSILLFGALKSKRAAIAIFGAFILLIPAIPRIVERILGAITFDITASARIVSWLEAIKIFFLSPLIGVGFNNLRFAKANLGFFEISQRLGGHSGAGVDSSFLLVLATTGIFGILAFLSFYFFLIYKNLSARTNFYSLAAAISLIALLFHSQFVNSFFFPWIAGLFWLKIAMSDVAELSKK